MPQTAIAAVRQHIRKMRYKPYSHTAGLDNSQFMGSLPSCQENSQKFQVFFRGRTGRSPHGPSPATDYTRDTRHVQYFLKIF